MHEMSIAPRLGYTNEQKGEPRLLDKQAIKHQLRKLLHVKTWQLVVIVLILSLMAATLLRLNNLGMIERRTAVIAADEKGDKAEIKDSLVELQHFISSHMNTDLNGGIYLSKSYERDRAAALEAASNTSNPQSSVYQQASIECRSRFQGGTASFRNDYVQCVIDRVSALGSSTDPAANIMLPKADNYRYDFSAPVVSFDLAGIVVVLTGVVVLIIIVRIATAIVLSAIMKRRYQSL